MPSLSSNDDVLVKIRTESDDDGVTKAKLSIDGLTGSFFKANLAVEALSIGFGLLESASRTIWDLGTAAFKSAASLEQNALAFRVMLGDAEKSKKLLKDISDFAIKTPFELTDLVEVTKRLLAYNIAADKIIPTLTMLGNISAGVGRDKMPQLILAFGQVRAATKLTGAELRQFTEAGVPLLTMLAEQMHTTEGAVQDLISEGKVGFPQVEQALNSLSAEGGRFFNLMEEQSKTYDGTVSNLRDNFGRMGREIIGISEDGTIREGSIFYVLSNQARMLLWWIDNNRAAIEDFGRTLLDRVGRLLRDDVIPWVMMFGQKLMDYITSEAFKRDLVNLVDRISDTARAIRDVIFWVDMATARFGGWLGTAKKVYDTVKAIYDLSPAGVTAKLLSGGLDALNGLGKRAEGGPVSAGVPYLVGERGPEIIVPKSSGAVIPNHQIGSGGITVNQTNHFYTDYDPSAAAKEIGFELAMAV